MDNFMGIEMEGYNVMKKNIRLHSIIPVITNEKTKEKHYALLITLHDYIDSLAGVAVTTKSKLKRVINIIAQDKRERKTMLKDLKMNIPIKFPPGCVPIIAEIRGKTKQYMDSLVLYDAEVSPQDARIPIDMAEAIVRGKVYVMSTGDVRKLPSGHFIAQELMTKSHYTLSGTISMDGLKRYVLFSKKPEELDLSVISDEDKISDNVFKTQIPGVYNLDLDELYIMPIGGNDEIQEKESTEEQEGILPEEIQSVQTEEITENIIAESS